MMTLEMARTRESSDILLNYFPCLFSLNSLFVAPGFPNNLYSEFSPPVCLI